jgi:hypothetical protein
VESEASFSEWSNFPNAWRAAVSYRQCGGDVCGENCQGDPCYKAFLQPLDKFDFEALSEVHGPEREQLIDTLAAVTNSINQSFRVMRAVLANRSNLSIALFDADGDLKLKFVRILGEDTDVRVEDN